LGEEKRWQRRATGAKGARGVPRQREVKKSKEDHRKRNASKESPPRVKNKRPAAMWTEGQAVAPAFVGPPWVRDGRQEWHKEY